MGALQGLTVDLGALRRKGEDRHHLGAALPKAWLQDALAKTDATVDRDGRADLDLWLQSDGAVVAQGRLAIRFSVPCARCLSPAAVDGGTSSLCLTYVPQSAAHADPAADDDGIPLAAEDLETLIYAGDRLDLGPALAEQVALAYPMRALCARGADCRGLCGGCGADLNAQPEAAACAQCGRAVGAGGAAAGPGAAPSGNGSEVAEDPALATPWQRALRKLRSDSEPS